MKSITFVVVMQRLVTSILVMALLVALATGCGRARYDARLVQADSLMWTAPDSALATLAAIDSLAGEASQAYRDLLMTQARYKCYADITASDDSAITRAMNYYRAHSGQREKLTRATLYKGAVMEELNHIDSAMYYYKTAELSADKEDHANLGQINTRIAALYRLYIADSEICLDKYKCALKHYQQSGNKRLQQNCLYNMAICSSISKTEDSKKYIRQSLKLATELNDSSAILLAKEHLSRQLLINDENIHEAKNIALDCLNNYSRFINHDLLLSLAEIYIKEDKLDSARYYLSFVNENTNIADRVKIRKLSILKMIAQKEGDLFMSNHYSNLSQRLSDSVLNNQDKYQIQRIENESIRQKELEQAHRINYLRWLLIFLGIALIIALLTSIVFYLRRMRYIKSITQELQHASVNNHEEFLEQIDKKDIVIERFVKNMVKFMQMSIETSEKDSPAVIRRRIKESISDIANNDFWKTLRSYLDRNYNNIISTIAQYPGITESDLRFIELSCCGFDYIESAITLGYSPNYISKKRKIISKKIGLSIPLQDYLSQMMSKH